MESKEKNDKENRIKNELEKRERVIQTYLIVFSLLTASNYNFEGKDNANAIAMIYFFAFLIPILIYYSYLISYEIYSKIIDLNFINFLVTIASLIFSFTILGYMDTIMGEMTSQNQSFPFFLIEYILLTVVIWASLIITPEFIKKRDLKNFTLYLVFIALIFIILVLVFKEFVWYIFLLLSIVLLLFLTQCLRQKIIKDSTYSISSQRCSRCCRYKRHIK